MAEYEVEQLARDAKVLQIYAARRDPGRSNRTAAVGLSARDRAVHEWH